jgi:hypothetical protein
MRWNGIRLQVTTTEASLEFAGRVSKRDAEVCGAEAYTEIATIVRSNLIFVPSNSVDIMFCC